MTEEEQQKFINKLHQRKANGSFAASYVLYLDTEKMEPHKLLDIMMLDESLLTAEGKEALDYLESLKESDEEVFGFRRFKWKLMAFQAIQDILTIPMIGENAINVMFKIKYFYYESKYILSEVILASLNGLHIGNKQLLRNFLEFNLQQCYFINRIYKEGSYQTFEEYIKTRISPGQSRLVSHAIPDDNFCKSLRKRVHLEFDHLSNRYSHAYSLDNSPKHDGIFRPGLTLDSLYFYIQISATLDVVLWTYYVNFPMLFRPVDIMRKFGFSPPPLFVMPDVTAVIEKAMTPPDFETFKKYAEQSEMANGHSEWYNSLPDLTEEEIWAGSDKEREENESVLAAYMKMVAQVRAYSEFIYETNEEKSERVKKMEEFDPKMADFYINYSQWQKVYKKFK